MEIIEHRKTKHNHTLEEQNEKTGICKQTSKQTGNGKQTERQMSRPADTETYKKTDNFKERQQ